MCQHPCKKLWSTSTAASNLESTPLAQLRWIGIVQLAFNSSLKRAPPQIAPGETLRLAMGILGGEKIFMGISLESGPNLKRKRKFEELCMLKKSHS